MFTLELLTLLNNIKKNDNDSTSKSSLFKLIKENPNEFEQFKQSLEYTGEIEQIITELEKSEGINTDNKTEESDDDLTKIKQVYTQWLTEYQKNSTVSSQCTQLIEAMILFYAPNRFDILEKLLEIQTDRNFELFKNHLKNKLRVYFSKQVIEYTKSDKYKSLNFFKKFKKKKEILNLMNKINEYTFDKKKLREVLQ